MIEAMNISSREAEPNQTTLLLHFDGEVGQRTTVDETGKTCEFVRGLGLLALQPAGRKFGTTCLRYNGALADSHLLVNSLDIIPSDLSDFTIEFFHYVASATPGGIYQIMEYGGLRIIYVPNAASLAVQDSGGLNITISGVVPGPAQHIRLVRRAGVLYCHRDGVQISSAAFNKAVPKSTLKLLGNGYANPDYSMNISIDEFRVSNVARNSGNFTPPTAAFDID